MKTKKSILFGIMVLFLPLLIMGQEASSDKTSQPEPRMYHRLVFDGNTNSVLLFSGVSKHGWETDLNEIWKYDLMKDLWTKLGLWDPLVSDSSEFISGITFDYKANRFIAFARNGKTWSYDLEDNVWQDMKPSVSPSPRCGQGMEYDIESDRTIMFGGFGCQSPNDPAFNDTWAYDYKSNNWTKMNPDTTPSQRMYFSTTYDQYNDRVVIWGGRLLKPISDNNIWTYNFNKDSWQFMENKGGPQKPLAYPSIVYRTKLKDIILFGGAILEAPYKGTPLNTTWSYNLKQNKWTQIFPKNSPPPRANHSMTYDPRRNEIILFGGELDGLYSNKVSGDSWIYDSKLNTWIKK